MQRVHARLRRATAPKGARVLARHPLTRQANGASKRLRGVSASLAIGTPRLDAVKHAQTAQACLLPLHRGIYRARAALFVEALCASAVSGPLAAGRSIRGAGPEAARVRGSRATAGGSRSRLRLQDRL